MMFSNSKCYVSPLAILSVCILTSQSIAKPQTTSTFESRIAPLLKSRCITCHQGKSPSGGLDLTSSSGFSHGGAHGPAIVAGDSDRSLLYQRISTRSMPPNMPLAVSEIAAFKQWIVDGGKWDADATLGGDTTPGPTRRAGLDWWSLRKLQSPPAPHVKLTSWVRNPIDAFILSRLESEVLSPSPAADRQTLIRRVTFDLIGIPPTPEEVSHFVADQSPDAYAKLIDRLLADPRYGECWGRHWLDVARFGESNGFERDALRPNAWPYRDYVVNAFNSDKPYAAFVREQIAGDLINASRSNGTAATGFLVGGPWDEVGVSQANATARLRVREEEMEEMVGTVSQTFLGLTVNCARCHDHKFDPIPQTDYYRMKSALEGVHPGVRSTITPQQLARANSIREQIRDAQEQIDHIELAAKSRIKQGNVVAAGHETAIPMAQWTFDIDAKDSRGALNGTLVGGARVERGRLILNGDGSFMRSSLLTRDLREKTLEAWIYLPNRAQRGGAAISIQSPDGTQFDAIVFGEREPGKWIAGSETFQRTHDLVASIESAPESALIQVAVVYSADNSIKVYRNGAPYAAPYTPTGTNATLRTYGAGRAEVLLGMRHLGGGNAFLKCEIEEARLYNHALTANEVASSYHSGPDTVPQSAIDAALTKDERQQLTVLSSSNASLKKQLDSETAAVECYAAAPTQPAPTALLKRGDVLSPAQLVSAGGLSCVVGPASNWDLSPDAPEAQRRLHLANWIADPANPLTSRVIVNRIWHYHFGRGIVASPNDFGYNGERPSHPELLDWLASEFLKRGGCIKQLTRLILLSSTYRESSRFSVSAAGKDADDRMLWRYPLRRLDGEAIRDSILSISGQLNQQRGGPSFQPFTEVVDNAHMYTLKDTDTPEYNRRSMYRMSVQSAKSPLLETLDCPDPSTKAPRRNTTTTPLQALELMNSSFVLRQAKYFAARVKKEAGSDVGREVNRAYVLALGRAPTVTEGARSAELVNSSGLETLCWTLFNMSEFVYVR